MNTLRKMGKYFFRLCLAFFLGLMLIGIAKLGFLIAQGKISPDVLRNVTIAGVFIALFAIFIGVMIQATTKPIRALLGYFDELSSGGVSSAGKSSVDKGGMSKRDRVESQLGITLFILIFGGFASLTGSWGWSLFILALIALFGLAINSYFEKGKSLVSGIGAWLRGKPANEKVLDLGERVEDREPYSVSWWQQVGNYLGLLVLLGVFLPFVVRLVVSFNYMAERQNIPNPLDYKILIADSLLLLAYFWIIRDHRSLSPRRRILWNRFLRLERLYQKHPPMPVIAYFFIPLILPASSVRRQEVAFFLDFSLLSALLLLPFAAIEYYNQPEAFVSMAFWINTMLAMIAQAVIFLVFLLPFNAALFHFGRQRNHKVLVATVVLSIGIAVFTWMFADVSSSSAVSSQTSVEEAATEVTTLAEEQRQ